VIRIGVGSRGVVHSFSNPKVYIINIGYSCLNRDCRDGEGDLKITQVLNLCPPREIQFTANHVIRSEVPIPCFIVWTNFSLLLKRQSDYLPGEGIIGGHAESLSYKLRYQLPIGVPPIHLLKMPFFDFEGYKIHYTVTGSETNPPVLLVHGWIISSRIYDSLVAALVPQYRAIAVDLVGFGQSASPDTCPYYILEGYNKLIYALLKHLSIPKIAWIGWSMGGVLALSFIKKHRDIISSLVLIASTPVGIVAENTSEFPEFPATMSSSIITEWMESIRTDYPTFCSTLVLSCFPEYTGTTPMPVYVKNALEDGMKISGQAAYEVLRNIVFDTDFRRTMGDIKIRCLVICGKKDQLTPPGVSEWMFEHLGSEEKKLVLFEDVGHAPFVGPSAEKCACEILTFMEAEKSQTSPPK